MRPAVALAAAALLAGFAAAAEAAKGPVHITADGVSYEDGDERLADIEDARRDAREAIDEARRGLGESERALHDMERDIADMETGDFARTLTIENGKVVKCGDPARYPGCVPYTAAEKAKMLAEMRADLVEARRDLEQAKHDLEVAQAEAAQLEQPRAR